MSLSTVFLIIFLGLFAVQTFIPERVLAVLCGIAAGVTAVLLLIHR
jgi:hypothetical protein